MEIPRQFQHLFFHVSGRENRASIERTGTLRATPIYDADNEKTGERGVFVTTRPSDEYGDDIYAADLKDYDLQPTEGYHYNPQPFDKIVLNKNVSDVKRVGHFYSPGGYVTEVHWHKEEDCPNGKK
jgi:hypothetical protein